MYKSHTQPSRDMYV